MIGEYKQKSLCQPRDEYDRPCSLRNGRNETWDDLPSWVRYCKFVRIFAFRTKMSDMEVIEEFSHYTIREWAELLDFDKKTAMSIV